MDRNEKEQLVSELKEAFTGAQAVIVVHQKGLSVNESQQLRRQMREAGASYRVAKNRLTKIALQGTAFEGISKLFKDTTAIAYANDPVAPAKVASQYAKDNEKLTILGGAMPDKVMSLAEIDALAKLPSLDQLRGKIIGVIQAPATKLAGVAQAPAGQLARVFQAYATQSEAA